MLGLLKLVKGKNPLSFLFFAKASEANPGRVNTDRAKASSSKKKERERFLFLTNTSETNTGQINASISEEKKTVPLLVSHTQLSFSSGGIRNQEQKYSLEH